MDEGGKISAFMPQPIKEVHVALKSFAIDNIVSAAFKQQAQAVAAKKSDMFVAL